MPNRMNKFVLLASVVMTIAGATACSQTAKPRTLASPAAQPATQATSRPASRPAEPFADEIERFEAADAQQMPAPHGIVFYGSSTIRIWDTNKWFPNLPVLNRGFGGSHMNEALHYARRALTKYQPKVVVLYEGDNDLPAGRTPAQVIDQLKQLIDVLHTDCPDAKLVLLSVKPSGSREKYRPQIDEVNRQFQAIAAQHPDWITYFDGASLVLDQQGKPRDELFRPDRLHMNEQAYQLWSEKLRPVLERLMKE